MKLLDKRIRDKQDAISVQQLPKGIYFLYFESCNHRVIKTKLVVR
jgi:hypothetical protein